MECLHLQLYTLENSSPTLPFSCTPGSYISCVILDRLLNLSELQTHLPYE